MSWLIQFSHHLPRLGILSSQLCLYSGSGRIEHLNFLSKRHCDMSCTAPEILHWQSHGVYLVFVAQKLDLPSKFPNFMGIPMSHPDHNTTQYAIVTASVTFYINPTFADVCTPENHGYSYSSYRRSKVQSSQNAQCWGSSSCHASRTRELQITTLCGIALLCPLSVGMY